MGSFLIALLVAAIYGCVEPSRHQIAGLEPAQASTSESAALGDVGLLLLVPYGQVLIHPQVTAWIDAGPETGVRVRTITDQQFKAMGAGALKYAGLILPDRLHVVADGALMKSVREYTQAGGTPFPDPG